MGISQDIQCRLSGGATNADPFKSLGGALSPALAPLRLFDDVSGAEASAGRTEYRLVYVYNNRSTTLKNAVVSIKINTDSTVTEVEIGRGASGMNGTEPPIATEGAVPPGVVFIAADTKETGLLIGDLPSGQKYPVWIRWRVNAGTGPVTSDPVTIRVDGEYEE